MFVLHVAQPVVDLCLDISLIIQIFDHVIRVLALTGARRNEVAALRWEYVDLEQGLITLPPKSHKSGHRSNKPKEIALGTSARAIVDKRQDNGSEYVFPSSRDNAHVSLSAKLWKLIRKEVERF